MALRLLCEFAGSFSNMTRRDEWAVGAAHLATGTEEHAHGSRDSSAAPTPAPPTLRQRADALRLRIRDTEQFTSQDRHEFWSLMESVPQRTSPGVALAFPGGCAPPPSPHFTAVSMTDLPGARTQRPLKGSKADTGEVAAEVSIADALRAFAATRLAPMELGHPGAPSHHRMRSALRGLVHAVWVAADRRGSACVTTAELLWLLEPGALGRTDPAGGAEPVHGGAGPSPAVSLPRQPEFKTGPDFAAGGPSARTPVSFVPADAAAGRPTDVFTYRETFEHSILDYSALLKAFAPTPGLDLKAIWESLPVSKRVSWEDVVELGGRAAARGGPVAGRPLTEEQRASILAAVERQAALAPVPHTPPFDRFVVHRPQPLAPAQKHPGDCNLELGRPRSDARALPGTRTLTVAERAALAQKIKRLRRRARKAKQE